MSGLNRTVPLASMARVGPITARTWKRTCWDCSTGSQAGAMSRCRSSGCKSVHAGVLERGQLSYPEDGTPQGGVISPLLANIYLHYMLDNWYGESVKPRMKGRTFLVRFTDDFILRFEKKEHGEKVYRVLFL